MQDLSFEQSNEGVTIVMPCYNGIRYIREAVESVLRQTDSRWRLLISDDGSNDGTRQYLSEIQHERVEVIFQPRNLGIFGNLNHLVSRVQGGLTYILCQDDEFCTSDAVRLILQEWSDQAGDVAYIRFNHSSDSQSALEHFEKEVLPAKVMPDSSDLFFFVFGCIPGNLSNVSFRTDIVEEFGHFDQTLPYAGDFEFWARVGRVRPWVITHTKVAVVRGHDGQASRNLNKKGELLPQLTRILDVLFANLVKQGHSPLRLRVFSTVCYVSMHRYMGIRQWMKDGSSLYVRLVGQTLGKAAFALPPALAWLTFFGTLGGKRLRVACAKWVLQGAK